MSPKVLRMVPGALRHAMMDLAEFGWVSVDSKEAAALVAEEAARLGVRVKVECFWWVVEEPERA